MITKSLHHIKKIEDSLDYLSTIPQYYINEENETVKDLETITLGNQQRFFFNHTKNIEKHNSSNNKNSIMKSTSNSSLLSRPISEILKKVDQIKFEKNLEKEKKKSLNNENSEEHIISSPIISTLSSLWVDKYSPKTFTQLLSAEKINRDVLKAFKRWDHFIFKENITNSMYNPNDYEPDGRPKRRVILLAGPPGSGKTTLAHIIASICKYNIIEINASDDRSPEVLKDLLFRATQNATLNFSPDTVKSKPNCIIFDEIDGIDNSKQAVDMLIEIIKAPLNVKNNKNKNIFPLTRPLICICNDIYSPSLRELKKHCEIFNFTLPHPNRLVERLSYICLQENIPVPPSIILHELVMATGLDIRSSINNLQFAAIKLQEDIVEMNKNEKDLKINKSNINNLKMVSIIESMMYMGLKDDNIDSYQVWSRIFIKDPSLYNKVSKKFTSVLTNSSSPSSQPPSSFYFDMVIESQLNHGDFSHIISGLHENIFKTCDNYNSHINKFSCSFDWFSWSDTFTSNIYNQTNNTNFSSLLQYLSLLGGAIHHFHSVNKKKIFLEWPKKEKSFAYQYKQNSNIINSIKNLIYTRNFSSLSSYLSSTSDTNSSTSITVSSSKSYGDVIFLIPILLDLITPKVRPLAFLSLSPDEKSKISYVVKIMESFGIHYVPIADGEIKPSYKNKQENEGKGEKENKNKNNGNIFLQDRVRLVLEPNLNQLITFTNCTELSARRPKELHPETCNIIYMEQRKYSIKLRVS